MRQGQTSKGEWPGKVSLVKRRAENHPASPAWGDQWRSVGMREAEAIHWWGLGIVPSEAKLWADAGYEPRQAEFVQVLIAYARAVLDAADQPTAPAQRWRRSRLSAHIVCLCLAAGTRAPEDVPRHVDGHLTFQEYENLTAEAMARGVDPWRLSFSSAHVSPPQASRSRALRTIWIKASTVVFACVRAIRPSLTGQGATRSGDPGPPRVPGSQSRRTERPR